ncbi:maleylpyruvate isomerase N-terminal domain-containing protein [Luedemannella helvata]|uniref:Mycothiol-dependent maleylpyruvate isomerase metal-binding domain-containing protein n=1 Tax=Luedemannella helvata TaxID=349315 RepID=A0ABP4WF33_9ACTN
MTIRSAYLQAARSAAQLLADPAVAAAWEQPSALAEFRVSGLAGHLGRQVSRVVELTAAGPATQTPIGLLDHFERSAWVGATVDSPTSVGVRESGEKDAAAGPAALADTIAAHVTALADTFATLPDDLVVSLPWAGWALTFDDFLVTRLLEIAVHNDDLAVSVGVDAPAQPEEVLEPVFALLTRLAVRQHGATAVLRALSRAERAPATIAAI